MPIRVGILHPAFANPKQSRSDAESLEEAVSLALALGFEIAFEDIVRMRAIVGSTFFGSGRCESLKRDIQRADAETVVIDGSITPVQQRNLERIWDVKILDRTGLILEIFASRARTREGVLQVELARLNYQKSRLVRQWTHLERQRGALGFVGGAGETQIEADRRAIDEQILRIKKKLETVVRTRGLHRNARKSVPYPVVALVGYTNAGKSTLFNRLTGAGVQATDLLFATLDPTMRAVRLPSGLQTVFSDTVGFISELPPQLIAAFRATLEEVVDADLVLHIRDISHRNASHHAGSVAKILEELEVGASHSQPVVEVWNKVDLVRASEKEEIAATPGANKEFFPVSARTGEGIKGLLRHIDELLRKNDRTETVKLSFSDGRQRAWLFKENVVQSESHCESGFEVNVRWSRSQSQRFRHLFSEIKPKELEADAPRA
ncbi:MAG: GTPase HflX [Albidovulum sp.]|nr:GTPase HflX [Albidovulum sp.]